MSSMNNTITAGLILVMSIVMAFVIQTVASIFPDDALLVDPNATDPQPTQLGSLVNTLPILLVIIGLIGSFVVLAKTARGAGNGGGLV